MSKKLAIQGHEQRDAVVINILKMLGGTNYNAAFGNNNETYYFINGEGIIDYDCTLDEDNDYLVFSLEEFLEKYPFKIGDKVFLYDNITEGCVTGMKWDEDKGTVKYCVYTSEECWCDVKELLKWNAIDLDEKHCEEHYEEMNEIQSKIDIDKSEFIITHMLLPDKIDDNLEYNIINGYEFDRVENGKIILKPIKPKYPTTYEECWKVRFEVDGETTLEEFHNVSGYYSEPLGALQKLLCCRDAYWKIYGEQMGLGKPWKPDWSNDDETKFCIYTTQNIISLDMFGVDNRILAFPTEEMRDVFYKNFKDLIEQCKELL